MSLLRYTYLLSRSCTNAHTVGTVNESVVHSESLGAMAACIRFNTKASFPHGIIMHRVATIHFRKARVLYHRALFRKF